MIFSFYISVLKKILSYMETEDNSDIHSYIKDKLEQSIEPFSLNSVSSKLVWLSLYEFDFKHIVKKILIEGLIQNND